MHEKQLAEIEGQHTVSDNPDYCTYDGDRMPCDTLLLIAEVRGLHKWLVRINYTTMEHLELDESGVDFIRDSSSKALKGETAP